MSLELSGTTPAIKGVAGSVSAPAITGDDVDTGISFPSANTIKFSTGGVERMSITDSGITGISGGKILQVQQTVKTDVSSRGGSSGTDALAAISGLSVDITPSATSSKIHVVVNIKQGTTSSAWVRYQLQRDSTAIYLGDTASGKTPAANFTYHGNDYGLFSVSENFLDSPNTTSQITYQVYWGVRTDSGKIAYINRTGYDTGDYAARTASSITAIEVSA
jgi:hypothetical protein